MIKNYQKLEYQKIINKKLHLTGICISNPDSGS